EALELVIQRAMARNPDERHATMSELELELAELDPTSGSVDGSLPSIAPPGDIGAGSSESGRPRTRARAAQTQHAMRAQREVRSARPILVLFTLIGYAWLVAAISTAAADALRWSRGLQGRITDSEAILILLVAFVATVTPVGIWVRHLERHVWRNTVTSVAFARRARSSLAVALSTQGILALTINLLESLVLRQSAGQLQAAYSAPTIIVSMFAGGLTFVIAGRKRQY
ncbi:MAG TPA: hypothetical protein VIV60_24110, partial [Polyangiaceae bacterium]